MKIAFLYDQGSAKIPEDAIIFSPPCYFGVSDGVSGVYLPQEGPRFFNGRTGGQATSRAICCAFEEALPGESLEHILRQANEIIYRLRRANCLSDGEPELWPSAAFAVAGILHESVNILQAGDSLAVWLMKDGSIGGTPNKAFVYEKDLLLTISELMKKHGQDRQKMWEEFRPILIKRRRDCINTSHSEGFALLNGDSNVEKFWQKFILPRQEIALLILFSDGFVPFEWTYNENHLAKEVIHLYQKDGLRAILEETRTMADKKKSSSHEDYAEATAIAIEF